MDVQEEAELDNISEKGADNGEDSWDALDDIRSLCGHSGSCGSCLNGDVCTLLRDMDINSPIVKLYEKENEKLVDQGALKTEKEIEEVQSESLQTEIEALRLELKRLNSNEEYRERAFTNLREAIKKKDGQLRNVRDELDYAQMEKNYYLYQIELLENKLKDSEESKENLRFEFDELKVIFDELKEKKDGEDNFVETEKNYYLYQIELLENKLKDSEESKENLRFEFDELKVIFDELKEKKDGEDNFVEMEKNYYLYQIEMLENKLKDSEESKENLRFECDELRVIFDELKEKKDGEDNFVETEKSYYLYQIELLENKLKDSEESKENLRFECDELRVIVDELKEKKDGEDNFADMEKSYYLYQIELLEVKLKESKESNEVLKFECDEAKEMLKDLKETTRRINSESIDYGYLREEVELLNGSLELGKNREEGLKSQLKCLEDELEKFRNKNKQTEVIYETPTVTIYKEKGKMALELSKTSDEENVEFNELLKQIEELTEQNKYLQETLITKTQAVDKEENPETILDAKQKKFKSGIKKLKKRIRENQREIERVGMFAWQRGCDTRDSALWMSFLKEERKELAYVRNSLKLQTQTSRDKERELENSKQRLQQKETKLAEAQEGLRHASETAGALQNVVEQMDSILHVGDSKTINSDISSILDDFDRNDLNDSANLDFSSLQEDEREEWKANSGEDFEEAEPLRTTIKSENVVEQLVGTEDVLNPAKEQLEELHKMLKNALKKAQRAERALRYREERWEEKTEKRDDEIKALKHDVRDKDLNIKSLKTYITQLEYNSVEFLKTLQWQLEEAKDSLKEQEATLEQAEEMIKTLLANSGLENVELDDNVDFLGKVDAAIKSLCRRYTQSTQSVMMKQETALRETEAVLTDSSPTDASSRPLTVSLDIKSYLRRIVSSRYLFVFEVREDWC